MKVMQCKIDWCQHRGWDELSGRRSQEYDESAPPSHMILACLEKLLKILSAMTWHGWGKVWFGMVTSNCLLSIFWCCPCQLLAIQWQCLGSYQHKSQKMVQDQLSRIFLFLFTDVNSFVCDQCELKFKHISSALILHIIAEKQEYTESGSRPSIHYDDDGEVNFG